MEQIIGDGVAAAANLIKDSNTKNFMADVIEVSKETPVLVDFWAPWCGPCKQLTPTLEKIVTAAAGAIKMVKVNIDESPELAQQLRIESIPAVFAFKDGQPVDAFMGALPESQIKSFIERFAGPVGPSAVEVALDAARAAAESGDHGAAANIYSEILQQAPDDPTALGGLTRALVAAGELDRAEETLALVPPAHNDHADVAAARSALALARESGEAGDVVELKAQVEAKPADHQTRFDYGMALFAAGQPEPAIDEFLEIVRRDAKWNEGAARKQILKVFEALGPTHELTVAGRRRLSSLLFS